jgi:hypothetical protein
MRIGFRGEDIPLFDEMLPQHPEEPTPSAETQSSSSSHGYISPTHQTSPIPSPVPSATPPTSSHHVS